MRSAPQAVAVAVAMLFVGSSRTASAQATDPAPQAPATTEPGSAPAEPAAPVAEKPAAATTNEVERKPWRYTGTLGIVALPRILSPEILVRRMRDSDRRWDLFAFGVGFEYLPPGLASFGADTNLSWMQIAADGRFHPWRWVFVGLRAGYQYSRVDSQKFGSSVEYLTESIIVSPRAGILHTFDSGLTIGGELGATIPIIPHSTLDSDGTTDSNARKVSKTFGQFVMPFVTAFRIGWTL